MLLRSECNHLRKEGRKLRMQLDQASQQIHIERQKLKRLNEEKRKLQGAMAQSQLQPQEQDEEVQQLDATGGAGLDLTGGADSWAGGLALPTPKTGRVIRGSTRPLVEVSSSRSKVGGMLSQLDDNNREIELQRIEIRRLREQVFLLMNQLNKGSNRGQLDPMAGAAPSVAEQAPLQPGAL